MNKVFSKKITNVIILIVTIIICFSAVTERVSASGVSANEISRFVNSFIGNKNDTYTKTEEKLIALSILREYLKDLGYSDEKIQKETDTMFNGNNTIGVTDDELRIFTGSDTEQEKVYPFNREEAEELTKTLLRDKYGLLEEEIDGIFIGDNELPLPYYIDSKETTQERLKRIKEILEFKELREVISKTIGESDNAKESKTTDFVPLAPIPGVIDKETAKDLSKFFNGLFAYGITIAGLLAVIMITVGGIQYMSADAVGGKTEGRERITYAVLGLLLVLFSWILLYTINPDILTLNLFNK